MIGTVCQFTRQAHAFQSRLSFASAVSCKSCCFTCLSCCEGFLHDQFGYCRVFLEVGAQFIVGNAVGEGTDLGIAQLGFGLAFKLSFLKLNRNNRCQALQHVLYGEFVAFLLKHPCFLCIVVKRLYKSGTETDLMGTAVCGMNVVCKGEDGGVVAVVILKRNFHGGTLSVSGIIDHIRMQDIPDILFLFMNEVYKAADSAFIVQHFAYRLFSAFIGEGNIDAAI